MHASPITSPPLPARSEDALRESEERTRRIIETAHDAFVSIDDRGIVTTWNPQAEATFGWTPEEACGRDLADLLIPDRFREAHRRGLMHYLATGEGPVLNKRIELSAIHRSGVEFPVEMTISAVRVGERSVFNAFLHDISDRKRSERYLLAQHAVAKVLAERDPLDEGALYAVLAALGESMGWQFGSLWQPASGDGDLACTELWHESGLAVPEFAALTREMTLPRGVGLPGSVFVTGEPAWVEDFADDRALPRRHAARHDGLHGAMCLPVRGSGRVIAAVEFLSQDARAADEPLLDLMATFGGQIGIFLERREVQRERAHQAMHDSLTGLPNRTLFVDRLTQMLAQTTRRPGSVAVFFLDVDNFKGINDSLGHAAGDGLLVALAERLQDALRPEDTVARLGGDEFVICALVTEEASAIRVAERLLAAAARPFSTGDHKAYLTASIGIALGAGSDMSPEDLLRDADTAMYSAKRRQPGSAATFEPGLRAAMVNRMRLEGPLREALDRGQLHLVYQPIVSLDGGAITAFEALLRWEHPSLGPLSPLEFIGVAEDSGLIVPIGRWVIERACSDAATWAGPAPPNVTVNLSSRQLMHRGFAGEVRAMLAHTGIEPHRLALEITESVLLGDDEHVTNSLGEVREAGVGLVLDDFGTGYSSLGYLKRFPLDMLKIDRSFIDGVVHEPEDRAIVEAVIGMAKGLGLSVVAEGIETEEQLAALRRLGCGYGQGYLFSRPVPPTDVAGLLAAFPPAR